MDNKEQIRFTKPVLKWVGGKTQILNEVLNKFPKKINNYYEPFIGGSSVLLGLLNLIQDGKIELTGKIYASDFNPNLINLYQNIQKKPDKLIKKLKKITKEYNLKNEESKQEYYYHIREQFNNMTIDRKTTTKASAYLIFLNKTCFRGLYRESKNGFNVSYGNYKNPSIFNEQHIKEVSKLYQNVIFKNRSFEHPIKKCKLGDFVYCDPPYAPETKKSFIKYTNSGFNIKKHNELFKLLNKINNKNIKFLMSNSDVLLIRNSFDKNIFNIETILCKRKINSKKPQSMVNEILLKNY